MIIRQMIQILYSTHTINPKLHREVDGLSLIDEEIGLLIEKERKKVFNYIMLIRQQLKQYLRSEDIEAAAFIVYRSSEEIIHSITITGTEIESEKLLSELEDMLIKYLFISD